MNGIYEICHKYETYEVYETYEMDYYDISNEEKTIKKKLKDLLNYCKILLPYEEIINMFDFDNDQMVNHLNFIFDKLFLFKYILEKYIENELNKEYKQYEFILGHVSVKNMIDVYINNDIYLKDSKDMLLKLNNIITKLQNN
jgi:hypothetical protein